MACGQPAAMLPALIVRWGGGYGMPVDPLRRQEADEFTFLLCGSCAAGSVAETPWLSPVSSFLTPDAQPDDDKAGDTPG